MIKTNKFEITQKNIDEVCILYLNGYLDAHTAPELENTIASIIEKGIFKILINFNNLDYISSAGLGVFMAFIEEIRKNEGDIKMSSMRTKVFSVFDLLGFPVLFDIEVDDDTALNKFAMGLNKKNEF